MGKDDQKPIQTMSIDTGNLTFNPDPGTGWLGQGNTGWSWSGFDWFNMEDANTIVHDDGTIGWDSEEPDEPYETSTSGNLDYTSMHPPAPDMSGVQHPNLTSSVLGEADYSGALKSLANYWADEIGDTDYTGADEFAKNEQFQNVFRDDTQGWRDDWGTDEAWVGVVGSPEDWKQHGGKRSRKVDLPFLTEVEGKFKSLEVALGYNSNTDLVKEVFPGYGGEIDESKLEERGDDASKVIGTPDNETGELKGGELVSSPDASGAWGQYLTSVDQIKETYTEDKKDAKEDYKASLKTIRDQKKALGGQARLGLREQVKKGSLTGFRRGARRGDVSSLQAQSREIGGLREKARIAYKNKLERLVIDKKQDIETKGNALRTKVETEFTELAGDVKLAKQDYQSDHLSLEDERSGNIYDLFQMYEAEDTAHPWPNDPAKKEEDE